MKKLLCALFAVILFAACLNLSAFAASAEQEPNFKFHDDGTFKIMQISDIQDGPHQVPLTMDYISQCVIEQQPDLIVLTGDWKNSSTGEGSIRAIARNDVKKAIACFMEPLQELGVPVAFTFGNHDIDGIINREEQMALFNEYPCFVGVDEGEAVSGCGNYNLTIKAHDSERVAFNMWFFDSNDGGVIKDRVDWYVSTANALKAANGGVNVPAVSFQHIIVEECRAAVQADENGNVTNGWGVIHEPSCPATDAATSLEFEAMKRQGDVVAMFFGHDHVNTFTVPYQGIDLVNTPTSGFGSYGETATRGMRIITLKENGTYSSSLINYYDKFCVDQMSTVRFLMCSDEYSNAQRLKWAGEYIVFNFKQGFVLGALKAIKEIIVTVM